MRVFITGGAGFIGSHLCETLILDGHEVTILDNLSTGEMQNLKNLNNNLNFVKGDIRNKNIVEELTSDSDLVLHMAAALGVENILENPLESIGTNLYGSEVVLNSAVKFNKRIIIASTSEIYGKNSKQPLTETDDRVIGTPQKLRWTYSDAKALEESTAYYLFLSKNLKVTTIRFFNTVGPRQTGKYGMVLPRFISAALENRELKIFGDGNQSRVFCHVKDAVEAIIGLALSDNTIGEVYNIGGLREIRIIELAKLIISLTESKSEITYSSYQDAYGIGFEDMMRRVPDISKIKSAIGWNPKIDLEQIIKDIIIDLKQ
jgi:UDP-glucose 4-epimerase